MSILATILIAQASAPPVPSPPVLITPPPSIDTVAHPRPTTPLGNPGTWATTNDYPVAALREERGGVVSFRLTVDATGQVSDCTITSSSGSPDLDVVTCALVTQRARFQPATDAKGKNTIGSYSNRVRWIIPDDIKPDPFFGPDGRFQAGEMTYRFFIEPDGSTSDCVLIINDTAETLAQPEGPCLVTMPYKPFLDENGKPVRKRVSFTFKTIVEDQPLP
jgi:TonB family protein